MVDAVLLEWENVLVVTEAARRDALRIALAAEGHAPGLADDERWLELDTERAAQLVLAGAGVADPVTAELVALRADREYGSRLAQGLTLSPGAAEFVAHAGARARIAVVTRASRAATEFALGLAGLADAVSHVTAADDVPACAPSAAHYRRALEALARRRALPPARAVVLARSRPAVLAARAAGARVVAVAAPAHVSLEAHGAVTSLEFMTLTHLAAHAGLAASERSA